MYVQQQTTHRQVHSTTNLRTFQKYSHVYSKLTSKGQMLNVMANYQRGGGDLIDKAKANRLSWTTFLKNVTSFLEYAIIIQDLQP